MQRQWRISQRESSQNALMRRCRLTYLYSTESSQVVLYFRYQGSAPAWDSVPVESVALTYHNSVSIRLEISIKHCERRDRWHAIA